MSTFWKIAIPVVIIAAVGVVWYYYSQPASPLGMQTNSSATQPYGSASGSSNPTTTTSVSGSSDSDIQTNLNSVDSQMSGLNSDSANADQGLDASSQ